MECLAAQHAELDAMLTRLDAGAWEAPVPDCPGWTVADVVLHLAQSDDAAVASAAGHFGAAGLARTGTVPARSDQAGGAAESGGAVGAGGAAPTVDEVAAALVEEERGVAPAELLARWRSTAARVRTALGQVEPSARLRWVAGELSARTLATTRLAEGWIHTGDVGRALGVPVGADDRLWHIARLAWRTIPYAFSRADRPAPAPVAVTLRAPDGESWSFGDDDAANTVRGDALDFCLVAGRRRTPGQTALVAAGPDAAAVLDLIRTYA
jgi:uncharacterized protein (TIGR03084 family)